MIWHMYDTIKMCELFSRKQKYKNMYLIFSISIRFPLSLSLCLYQIESYQTILYIYDIYKSFNMYMIYDDMIYMSF